MYLYSGVNLNRFALRELTNSAFKKNKRLTYLTILVINVCLKIAFHYINTGHEYV